MLLRVVAQFSAQADDTTLNIVAWKLFIFNTLLLVKVVIDKIHVSRKLPKNCEEKDFYFICFVLNAHLLVTLFRCYLNNTSNT